MEVVASLSQGRTAAAQCGLFTHKSVPVIFEPPYIYSSMKCMAKFGTRKKMLVLCLSIPLSIKTGRCNYNCNYFNFHDYRTVVLIAVMKKLITVKHT